MKNFKSFLIESKFEYTNKILQQYVNGEMPDDFDNEQVNPKDLFKQINKLFNDNNLPYIITKDGVPFVGDGIVLKTETPYHFELTSKTKEIQPESLHVELKKKDNGNFFFSFLKVEPK